VGDVEHSFEPTQRRVRVRFGGVDVADTKRALLMMGGYKAPLYELSNYYFPREDVRSDLLVESAHRSRCDTRGEATHWTVRAGDREATADAWSYESPPAGWEGIRGYVAFTWNSMDAWLEEDEEVFVHPRDPHHRVDVLRSSRRVRVRIGGELVADSARPCLLFETGMPTRYYLPRADVRMELLGDSETRTQCPYKGIAGYFAATVGGHRHDDIAWTYVMPVPECPKIEQLVCFFNEKVETEVDGVVEAPPATKWTTGIPDRDLV
jgi:uncharacterized protein (DUF427 family)